MTWKVTVSDEKGNVLQDWEQPIEPEATKLSDYVDVAFPGREVNVKVEDLEDGDDTVTV